MVIALINQPWDRKKCIDLDTQNTLYGGFISISFTYNLNKLYMGIIWYMFIALQIFSTR